MPNDPDLNLVLDNLYQLPDAEAPRIMHTALCNLRDSGDTYTSEEVAYYLITAADGKLG
jgi:hypothetical protein